MKSVLIVEDDQAVRNLIVETLQKAGYRVRSVGRAEDALASLRSRSVDLVLLDLGMPPGTMQGMELLARLREAEAWRQLPVVILSGYGDLVNRDITARLGVSAVLSKPLRHVAQLVEVLNGILR